MSKTTSGMHKVKLTPEDAEALIKMGDVQCNHSDREWRLGNWTCTECGDVLRQKPAEQRKENKQMRLIRGLTPERDMPEPKPAQGHTPGPWAVASQGLGQNAAVFQQGTFQLVADCNAGKQDEAQANARLIAAAPDLLAFAKGVARDVLRESCKGHKAFGVYEDQRCECSACAYLRTSDELIAKAEGRAA